MVELTDAFVRALTAAQIHARSARPALPNPRLKQSAVAVDVEKLESAPGGFSAYLGVHDGHELFGARLCATVRLDVLSPVQLGAGECRLAQDRAREVLAQGVEGVSILAVTARAPEYDPVGDCFTARLEVQCRCWLCAGADQDGLPELTHFILKGALT